MKHGIVRNGRNVTMYGRDAQNWLVQMNCCKVDTIQGAVKTIRSYAPGPMQEQAIAYFRGLWLKDKGETRVQFDPTSLIEELQREEEARVAAAKVRRRNEILKELASSEVKVATSRLKKPCFVCDEVVKKGDQYQRTHHHRVHIACL